MKTDFIDLKESDKSQIWDIFSIADNLRDGAYRDCLKGKTIVMFFPNSSIRTRVTFEKGICLLGGQTILFPSETLDKKEKIVDVCGYLNNWADLIIVRHMDIELIRRMSAYLKIPVINAMTDVNHPCEIVSDLYALSKIRKDFTKDSFLFCGKNGNIGNTWRDAAKVFGFKFMQCCGKGYEIEDVDISYDIREAIVHKTIVCTDSLSETDLNSFRDCQVTKEMMDRANTGAVLNPCPPFYRGEEVSEDVIESEYFVGYEFKKCLLEVQQAIIVYCLGR